MNTQSQQGLQPPAVSQTGQRLPNREGFLTPASLKRQRRQDRHGRKSALRPFPLSLLRVGPFGLNHRRTSKIPPRPVPNLRALHTSPARTDLGWIPPSTRSPANRVVHAAPQPPTPAAPSPDPWSRSGSALPRQWGEVVIARGNQDPRDTRRMKRGSPRRSRDDGEGLAQRRRGAEEMGFSISSSESPSGARVQGCLNSHLPLLLSVSAPLREMSAARELLWNGDEDVATPFHAGAV
jgi:hypothetical protein